MCCANALDAAASRRQATAVPPQKDESHFPRTLHLYEFIYFSPKHVGMCRNRQSQTLRCVTPPSFNVANCESACADRDCVARSSPKKQESNLGSHACLRKLHS